jgi:outer membrane protein TolC
MVIIPAAERRVAAANAQVGVATAAFFPDISLSGSYGGSASRLADITAAPARAWSLGLDLAETLIDFGRRGAVVDQAKAAYDAKRIALKQYRQGVIDQTALIVAQNAARDARISSLSASLDRTTNAVSLIEALGGGWN